jgi:hypothetical protein
MPTTSTDVLVEEILSSLGIESKPKSIDRFIRNITLGGYNVTWGMRKPTIQAFDKGTAVRMTFAEDVEVPEGKTIMIGERTAEGYGEASVSVFYPDERKYIDDIVQQAGKGRDLVIDASSEFASRIAEPLLDAFIKNRAVREVGRNAKKMREDAGTYRPTVSNMILMAKEAETIEDLMKKETEETETDSENKNEK